MFRNTMRRLVTIGLVLLVLLGAGTLTATAAQAAPVASYAAVGQSPLAGPVGVPAGPQLLSADDCPAYYLCFFADQDFSGPWVYYAATINNNTTCYNIAAPFNNQASSMINNFTRNARLYDGSGCTGTYLPVNKNGGRQNCQTWLQCSVSGVSQNDKLSSWRFE